MKKIVILACSVILAGTIPVSFVFSGKISSYCTEKINQIHKVLLYSSCSFEKESNNPVFGDETIGVTFDPYVTYDGEKYRMDFSWRKCGSCAVTYSKDGINWDSPQITLSPDGESGWEDAVNRNCVLYIDGIYKMWYTGQSGSDSNIGYAESIDGVTFKRVRNTPVLKPEYDWEKSSVMNPCVIYDDCKYKIWYSAGEMFEPNVNGYAESNDGLTWEKHQTPVFTSDNKNSYEKERVGGCQVIKTEDMGYLMFYIGYFDVNSACVCLARSEDGINNWERSELNPLVTPSNNEWDRNSCYKPTVIWNANENKWMLWYNGRYYTDEYIGLAEYYTRDLF